jgi:serine/threonine-protein kinase
MQALESVATSSKDNAQTIAPENQGEALPRRFERFTLLSRVARGGMGEVYLATAAGIEGAERPLIVKIIRQDHADDRSFKARFLDEARIQAQLQHPGVAQILEATTDKDGAPYVVVEHVEGRNLSEVRGRAAQLGMRIGWPEAMAIGVCLGEGLTHVHERTCPDGRPLEIVHRDLSPQNVMLGYGGEVKLIDFGTARGQNRRCQTAACRPICTRSASYSGSWSPAAVSCRVRPPSTWPQSAPASAPCRRSRRSPVAPPSSTT